QNCACHKSVPQTSSVLCMLIAGDSFTVLMYSVKRMPRRCASTTSRGGRAARKSSKRFAGAEEDPY
ncbi:hypothetical protein, partial [Klebsiella pneumoniae]|uniref:hypothetical protein n=2 Tax=Klebsiella pneumoniae TaxID=573 RepID=UPI001C60C25D